MQTLNMLLSAVDYDNMYVIATLSILPLMLLMFICGISVQLTFKKNAKKVSSSGLTGAEAARKILNGAGLSSTLIAPCPGSLTDHYDPRNDTVFLSESVYNSNSVAAIGVARTKSATPYSTPRTTPSSSFAPRSYRSPISPLVTAPFS